MECVVRVWLSALSECECRSVRESWEEGNEGA